MTSLACTRARVHGRAEGSLCTGSVDPHERPRRRTVVVGRPQSRERADRQTRDAAMAPWRLGGGRPPHPSPTGSWCELDVRWPAVARSRSASSGRLCRGAHGCRWRALQRDQQPSRLVRQASELVRQASGLVRRRCVSRAVGAVSLRAVGASAPAAEKPGRGVLSGLPRVAGPPRPRRRCGGAGAATRTWRRVPVPSQCWDDGRRGPRRGPASRHGSA